MGEREREGGREERREEGEKGREGEMEGRQQVGREGGKGREGNLTYCPRLFPLHVKHTN